MADQQTPSTANPIRVVLVDTGGNIIGSLPVTIADNGDFALGSVNDAAWSGTGAATVIALLKAQARLTDTQPVSVASLPLPSGAATEASLTQLVTNAAPQPWFMGQPGFFATGN